MEARKLAKAESVSRDPEDLSFKFLSDPEASLQSVITAVENIGDSMTCSSTVSIGISSNCVIDMLEIFLRRHGYLHNVEVDVVQGSYDDLQGDVRFFQERGVEYLIVAPFFDNLFPAFESTIGNLSSSEIDSRITSTIENYRLNLTKANWFKEIFFLTFEPFLPSSQRDEKILEVCERINKELHSVFRDVKNIVFINTKSIICNLGVSQCFDPRFYSINKSPFKYKFLNEVACFLAAKTRGFQSYFYKVLVLDCDNTLWDGVVGELGANGVGLNPSEYPGNIFWRMQHVFSSLQKKGVLLVLSTKNNQEDIDQIFLKNENMIIQKEQIIACRANWDDKASNIISLAEDLNLGLSSFIFLDDSKFECESIRNRLPEVHVIQVPENKSEYLNITMDLESLFQVSSSSIDTLAPDKTMQYRAIEAAKKIRGNFDSHEDYLRSLEILVSMELNSSDSIERVSELSRKTNQFNLTTKRYDNGEISSLVESDLFDVFSFSVSDKFGDCGITGAVILEYRSKVIVVDSFFMSCRIIGRDVEFAIWPLICKYARRFGHERLIANYFETKKNVQVKDFFDRLGMRLVCEKPLVRSYEVNLDLLGEKKIDFVGVSVNGRQTEEFDGSSIEYR